MNNPFNKSSKKTIVCVCCGKEIKDHLPALTFNTPDYWIDDFSDKPNHFLDTDFCNVNNVAFFTRTVLKIPIIDTEEFLEWGIWVSLSKKSFNSYRKVYGTKMELAEEPYFGWISNQIKGYPDCLKIKTLVHLQGGGLRPLLELDHKNMHPLCQEQHTGITMERAHELVSLLVG